MSLFQKREWMLLAKGEPLSLGHSQRVPASTFYVIMPSNSPTLLVKAVATRELMLPSPFPLLPEDPPEDSHKTVEAISPAWGWDGEALEREIRNYINYISAGLPADLKGQSLAAKRMQREEGPSGCGSLSVSIWGQWFLAQDVVAGKPDCSGMLCSYVPPSLLNSPQARNSVFLPCRLENPHPTSILDGLELEPTYNPLQVWSHLYSHLSSTFAKPQGRLYPNWENRTPRKAGQLQTNRVRATVLPLPMTPALSTAPKLPAASKASSEAFFRPSEWRKSIPHGPELLAPECSHPTQPPRPCQDPHNGYL
ncbi:hypothetical protein GHT09_000289 [Marmota monax]|uniref:Uncharacterized protein n=2 Tax=Marmota monax TaxID=9995 RepID=A0A834R202_MARMO|nr:hypothetical protein GHT09_000289 [Marmota monax]